MTHRALLIENDEALGHWLHAVLAEAGIVADWHRDVDAASSAVAAGLVEYGVVVVEGVLGGIGVELAQAARGQGKKTMLLVPRGASIMSGVADRILEHPLTRSGFEEAIAALLGGVAAAAAPAPAEPVPTVDDKLRRAVLDRMRLGRAALAEGNFEAACIELDAAAVLAPDDEEPRLLGAWARYCRVRPAVREAATIRQRLVESAERASTADAFFFAASAAHDFGDVDLALQQANRALAVDASHVGARQLIEIITHGGPR